MSDDFDKWFKMLERNKIGELPWGNSLYIDCPFCKEKETMRISRDRGNGHIHCHCTKCDRMFFQ